MPNFANPPWRKSSHSGTGDCIETAALDAAVVGVRDSTDPDGPVLVLGRGEWARLVGVLKATTARA